MPRGKSGSDAPARKCYLDRYRDRDVLTGDVISLSGHHLSSYDFISDYNYTIVEHGSDVHWNNIPWTCPNGGEPAIIDNPQKQLDMMRQLG